MKAWAHCLLQVGDCCPAVWMVLIPYAFVNILFSIISHFSHKCRSILIICHHRKQCKKHNQKRCPIYSQASMATRKGIFWMQYHQSQEWNRKNKESMIKRTKCEWMTNDMASSWQLHEHEKLALDPMLLHHSICPLCGPNKWCSNVQLAFTTVLDHAVPCLEQPWAKIRMNTLPQQKAWKTSFYPIRCFCDTPFPVWVQQRVGSCCASVGAALGENKHIDTV